MGNSCVSTTRITTGFTEQWPATRLRKCDRRITCFDISHIADNNNSAGRYHPRTICIGPGQERQDLIKWLSRGHTQPSIGRDRKTLIGVCPWCCQPQGLDPLLIRSGHQWIAEGHIEVYRT